MAFLINLFTAISVTVSVFVMGIGMKNTLDDQLKHTASRRASIDVILRAAAGIGALVPHNPHVFVELLAGITSFDLNIEVGVFITNLLVQSRWPIWKHTISETKLSSFTGAVLVVAVGSYFTGAVIIDLVLHIL